MTTIRLARHPGMPTEGQRSSFRSVLFQMAEGLTPDDRKAWRAFWSKVFTAEAGELFDLQTSFVRNPKFHRKFFALLKVGFDAWDPAHGRKRLKHRGVTIMKDLDAFRKDVIIMAGFYDATYSIDGKLKLEAKSMSFASMDQIEFERLYEAVLTVLLEKVLARYTREDIENQVQAILSFAS